MNMQASIENSFFLSEKNQSIETYRKYASLSSESETKSSISLFVVCVFPLFLFLRSIQKDAIQYRNRWRWTRIGVLMVSKEHGR